MIPEDGKLKSKICQVTSLLNSFLDQTELQRIRRQRSKQDRLYNLKLNKQRIDDQANDMISSALRMNQDSIWQNPERLKQELAGNAPLAIEP